MNFGEAPESQSAQSDCGQEKSTGHVINVYSGTAIGDSCTHARPAECTSPCIGFHWACVIHWMIGFRAGCGLSTRRTKGCVQPSDPKHAIVLDMTLTLLGMAASATDLDSCRTSKRARPYRPSCALVSATRSGGAAVSGFSFSNENDRARSNIPEHCSKPRRATFRVLLHQAVAVIRATVGSVPANKRGGYAPDTQRVWNC